MKVKIPPPPFTGMYPNGARMIILFYYPWMGTGYLSLCIMLTKRVVGLQHLNIHGTWITVYILTYIKIVTPVPRRDLIGTAVITWLTARCRARCRYMLKTASIAIYSISLFNFKNVMMYFTFRMIQTQKLTCKDHPSSLNWYLEQGTKHVTRTLHSSALKEMISKNFTAKFHVAASCMTLNIQDVWYIVVRWFYACTLLYSFDNLTEDKRIVKTKIYKLVAK
jgi:hypothetical protein